MIHFLLFVFVVVALLIGGVFYANWEANLPGEALRLTQERQRSAALAYRDENWLREQAKLIADSEKAAADRIEYAEPERIR